MRVLNFSDGFTSESAPDVGQVKASSLMSFLSDDDFLGAKGSAAEPGDIYFNETLQILKLYRDSGWVALTIDRFFQRFDITSNTAAPSVLNLSFKFLAGANQLIVALNGQLLDESQYNEGTSGTVQQTITLGFAVVAGDSITVRK